MKKLLSFNIVMMLISLSLFSQSVIPYQPKQSKPIAITDATIHTLTKGNIENGTVLFENGVITNVGKNITLPTGTEIISAKGKHVYPAIISAQSILGLTEIDQVKSTHDNAEIANNNSDLRAEVAYEHDSEYIPVGRSNGVAYNLTTPNGGLIGGHAAMMRLDAWTNKEAVVQSMVGLVVRWPRMTPFNAPWMRMSLDEQKKNIQKSLDDLENIFSQAKAYHQAKLSESDKNIPYHAYDSKLDMLGLVVKGEEPLLIYANDIQQIKSAVSFTKRLGLKMILVGGSDSWMVTDLLKENHIPVIIGTNFERPDKRDADYDITYKLANLLFQSGVQFCISTGSADNPGGETNLRNLPYEAGLAVAYGLPNDEGYKSISLYPAQILGLSDKLGSIESGKAASLLVTDGDPLQVLTTTESVFIDGKKIPLTNHHTLMRDKYDERYRQMKAYVK